MVYVIKYLDFSYDSASTEIVSICASQEKAFKYAIDSIIKEIHYDHYDPRNRYYTRKEYRFVKQTDEVCHTDKWDCYVGCHEYTIEEWILDDENSTKVKTWNINIDKLIKELIIENKIMPKMINKFIKSLSSQLDTIDICMKIEKESFGLSWAKRRSPKDDVVRTWNKFYGKKPDEEIGY